MKRLFKRYKDKTAKFKTNLRRGRPLNILSELFAKAYFAPRPDVNLPGWVKYGMNVIRMGNIANVVAEIIYVQCKGANIHNYAKESLGNGVMITKEHKLMFKETMCAPLRTQFVIKYNRSSITNYDLLITAWYDETGHIELIVEEINKG